MKFYSIYYTHKPGGFCKRLYRFLNALAQQGHEVTYLSLDPPHKSLSSKISFEKIPFPLKSRSGYLFWILFSFWSMTYCFWKSFRFVEINRWVVFSPFYASLLSPVRLIFGIPLVCFIRSKLAPNSHSFLFNIAENLTQIIALKTSDSIIVQTQSNFDLASKLGCKEIKLTILPNNIDEIHPLATADTKPLEILCTGVFTRKKNLNFLKEVWFKLESLSKSKKIQCPLIKLVGIIRDPINQNEFPRSMEFEAWTDDLIQYYKTAQVYLHPSSHEGMPNSVLEALAHGLITLVANTEELNELTGSSELCFDLKNPEDLAAKLLKIQEEPALFNNLKELSLKRAKDFCFDWDKKAVELAVN